MYGTRHRPVTLKLDNTPEGTPRITIDWFEISKDVPIDVCSVFLDIQNVLLDNVGRPEK